MSVFRLAKAVVSGPCSFWEILVKTPKGVVNFTELNLPLTYPFIKYDGVLTGRSYIPLWGELDEEKGEFNLWVKIFPNFFKKKKIGDMELIYDLEKEDFAKFKEHHRAGATIKIGSPENYVESNFVEIYEKAKKLNSFGIELIPLVFLEDKTSLEPIKKAILEKFEMKKIFIANMHLWDLDYSRLDIWGYIYEPNGDKYNIYETTKRAIGYIEKVGEISKELVEKCLIRTRPLITGKELIDAIDDYLEDVHFHIYPHMLAVKDANSFVKAIRFFKRDFNTAILFPDGGTYILEQFKRWGAFFYPFLNGKILPVFLTKEGIKLDKENLKKLLEEIGEEVTI